MQRMCDFNLDTDDLAGLNANVEAKKALIDTYNSARCTAQLDKMKEIIRKVENGETMWQGNGDVYEDK